MSATYVLTSDVGKFRAIFPDTDLSSPLFQDEEIQVFLDLEGDLRRARARGLERAASDLVLTLRVTKVLGLEVNGVSAGQELRLEAAAEREKAAEAEARDKPMFDWAEMALDDFSARERIAAELLRSGI